MKIPDNYEKVDWTDLSDDVHAYVEGEGFLVEGTLKEGFYSTADRPYFVIESKGGPRVTVKEDYTYYIEKPPPPATLSNGVYFLRVKVEGGTTGNPVLDAEVRSQYRIGV